MLSQRGDAAAATVSRELRATASNNSRAERPPRLSFNLRGANAGL